MLDSYIPGTSSQDELDLIKELYQSVERLKHDIVRIAGETVKSDEMLGNKINNN